MRVLAIVLFVTISVCKSEPLDPANDFLQKWANMEKRMKTYVKMFVKEFRKPMLKVAVKVNLTRKCQNHLIKLALGLNRAELWAISLLAGNGLFMKGFTSMHTSEYGSYRHCIDQTVPHPFDKKPPSNVFFRGKYCTVEISPPLPPKPRFYTLNEPLPELKDFSRTSTTVVRKIAGYAQVNYFSPSRVGICMPSSCTVEDVEDLLRSVVSEILPLEVRVRRCETKNLMVVNKEQIIVSCIFGIFFLFVVGGTVLEVCIYLFPNIKEYCKEGALPQIILTFSINKSIENLLRVEKRTHYLRPVYGIRFLTMMWLFLGWSYEEATFKYFHGEPRNLGFRRSIWLIPFLNYTVAIDTLFFTSGLLTSYNILRRAIDEKKASQFLFDVVSRLRRVLPSLMLVIAMTVYLPWIGSGPVWHDVIDPVVEGCRRKWWTNLLHINNYVGVDNPCLKNSWFLAADFQLYLLSLIIVYILCRHPKIGMMCNIAIFFTSIASSGIITWIKKLPPTLLFIHPDPNDRKEFLTSLYQLPYSHASACCVGITVGYILVLYPKLTMKWWIQILGWISAILVSFFIIYGIYNWNQGYEINPVAGMMYVCIHRTAWALAISWLLVACCTGYGGIINSFLSWEAFEQLSRLSFLAYIIYNLSSAALLGSAKEVMLYQHHFIIMFMISTTIITYGMTLLAGCLWYAPLLAIHQIVKTHKVNISKNVDFKQKVIQSDKYVLKNNF